MDPKATYKHHFWGGNEVNRMTLRWAKNVKLESIQCYKASRSADLAVFSTPHPTLLRHVQLNI
jgi:hypothetical protein